MITTMTLDHHTLAICAPDGPPLARDTDATDLIGELWGQNVDMIVVPATRFSPDFFVLSTRVAGEIVQKFVTYGLHLVVLGDLSDRLADSEPLAAYVREANRGRHVWFLPTFDDLTAKLG